MTISIYKYPQVLHLTVGNILPNCERTGVNMIVSQHYTNSLLKLFRNTDQTVDLLLKDWDRRPVKFSDVEHVWFKLFDGTREIMEKEADLLDWDRGHYVLDFSKMETALLDLGNKNTWCIVVKNTDDDTVRMLWTNQEYGAHAPAMVIEGPLPNQPEAQVVTFGSMLSDYFTSSALKGAAQVTNPQGVHSLVFILDAYTGAIVIEGSLDADIPATDDDWTLIKVVTYSAVTGTEHESFVGNYNWVRLKTMTTTGIDTVTYRNV